MSSEVWFRTSRGSKCFWSNSQAVRNVQTACLPIHPPLFIIFGLSSTSAEFFVGKMYLVRRDCMIAFFFIYQLPLWILPCLVDPNVPFMGWCSTDTFKKTRAESLTECVMACNNGAICQSVNYIINEDVCELNNRTKKARPDDLVPHENSIYVTRFSERGIGRGSRVVM